MKRSRKMVFVYALGVMLGVVAVSWLSLSAQAERGRKGFPSPTPQPIQNGLAAALNPDGTLRSGVSGSFNASGFRMALTATGAPSFVPVAVCNGWDTQFSLSNAVGGVVRALVVSGTNIYVGGDFTVAGNVGANHIAKFNTLTNTWSALGTGGGNGVDGAVLALALSGSNLYVGGQFTMANIGPTPVGAKNIAKVDTTTGVWSALGTGGGNGVNLTVTALAVSGDDLYVGGAFTGANIGPTPIVANHIAKVNTTTGVWSKLGTDGNGVDNGVTALALSGSDLYVGGGFTMANADGTTISANRVAKVNTTSGVWSALGTGGGNGVDQPVFALALSGSDLYVGGDFTTANVGPTSISANRVAKVNTTTGVWSKLGTDGNGTSGRVNGLTVSGSDLYVGGAFTMANVGPTPVNANNVAKVNTTTGVWSVLGTGGGNGVSDAVYALALNGSDLYVGGLFTTANVGPTSINSNFVAKVNTLTGSWSTLGTGGNGVNSAVQALAVSGTDIYVGGSFTVVGNVGANRVAKFNTLTNTWSALGTGGGNGVDGPVSALALIGSDLYVGGTFTTANVGGSTVSVNNIAKVNTTTGAWSKLGTGNGNGVNNAARALAVSGSDLFVAGAFSTANVNGTTVNVNGVARFNTLTNTWSKLGTGGGSGVDFDVLALAINGNDLFVGGSFWTVNVGGPTVSATNVAKVNTVTGVWSALGGNGNGVSDEVRTLAVSGSDLFVGGQFLSANVSGTPISTNWVARFNTLTNIWSKLGTDGNGVNCIVTALAVSGSDLYVGGCFKTANVGGTTVSTNGVAKFNTTTGVWSALADMGGGNGVDDTVLALAPSGNDLFVGGHFTAAGDNKPSLYIARYCLPPPPALPAPQANTLTKPVPTDPLLCAGDLINGSFAQTNTTAGALSGRVFATLQNLAAIPASVTCTLNPAVGGATTFCAVENGAPTWRGTLAAGQSVTISYQAQVTDNAAGQVCSIAQSQFPDVTGTIATAAPFCLTLNCPAVGPGLPITSSSEANSQKAGSVLFYNLYSSSIAAPNTQNTRVSLTNTHPTRPIAVHLFFVDGATCSIADSLVCLTPNQTASFLASDIDPGTTGYIIAVASDLVTGCPANFNYLIGDEYVKLSSGHAANLTAESFAALPGGLPACNASSVTTVLNFDGTSYNRAPRVVAASNIPARADGNDTLIVLNRVGGSLAAGAATLGSLFGILYDDAENPLSFNFTAGVCQFRSSLSNNFPRTAPRFEQFIPAGRSGWAKFYSLADIGLLGAQLNFNPNAGTAASAFNQGHNLHKLTLTSAAQLTIPIFPPNC